MKFRYIGSNDNMTAFGYDFRDGKTPEVTDENAVKRLSGNRFFEAVAPAEAKEAAPSVADAIAEVFKKKPGRKPKAAQEP
jgi:hypothetical protein